MARRIRHMRRKLHHPAMTQLEITKDGTTEVLTNPDDIAQACIQANVEKFSQIHNLIPLSPQSLAGIGWYGEGPWSQHILNGRWEQEHPNKEFTTFLRAMEMPKAVQKLGTIGPALSPEENAEAWKRQSEYTSSDPFSPHMGHFKASLTDPTLNQVDALFRSLPAQHGFSPKLWQQITDVQILKKDGDYNVSKMRSIQLFHSEYNMNNKKLGREVMEQAEKAGTLAEEQNGSQKGRTPNMTVVNKHLTIDLVHMQHRAAAIGSTDCNSCFDRVSHNISYLSTVRNGASPTAVKSMFRTLQAAHHRVRTAFGVSDNGYGPTKKTLQGLGQGNGFALAGWAMISSAIIAELKKTGFGLDVLLVITKEHMAFSCYAFVDDADLIHAAQNTTIMGEEIVEQMQKGVDTWEQNCAFTGGSIRPEKCYWYLIDYEWDGHHWKYRPKATMLREISVKNHNQERHTIKRLETSQAIETLGIYLAIDGNTKPQVNAL